MIRRTHMYYLDGEPIDWEALISFATARGLQWQDRSFKTTSEAAQYLRDLGHTISKQPPSKPNNAT